MPEGFPPSHFVGAHSSEPTLKMELVFPADPPVRHYWRRLGDEVQIATEHNKNLEKAK
jgi:hypothetical protein